MNKPIKCPHCKKIFFDNNNERCPFCGKLLNDGVEFLKNMFNLGD